MSKSKVLIAIGVMVATIIGVGVAAGQNASSCVTGGAVPSGNTGLASDCEILLGMRDTLRGSASLNWSTSLPITRWTGVRLGGTPQRVTIVKLQKQKLTGSIPSGIGSLDKLVDLWLYTNELAGPLPADLGNLSDLETLMLSNNNLSGQIPQTLDNLSLKRLWLRGNKFTGCMPANLLEVPDGDAASLRLPSCGSATPLPASPTATPQPTATPVSSQPTQGPSDDRLAAVEDRVSDLERRLAAIEAILARLVGTPTATPARTDTPTPLPTASPTHTPTPTPTNTPVPVVKLVLRAESRVVGYWSDGTADVEVTATLRNEGTLRLDRAQDITATCIAEGDERRACREEVSLSLQDGFAPNSESFSLRLPMGTTTMTFDYGGVESLAFDVEVPERILGVDRDVWECYAHRPPGGVEVDGDVRAGCGGWRTPTVEKWLNDVPVKVWATGDATHIATLETVLMELSPIMDMEFEWVGSEEEADFKAFVGVPRSDAPALGIDRDDPLVHAWGFASASMNGGEATSGRMVIWESDLTWSSSPIDLIRSVTIHEALHALVPMIGHSTRPVSIMGGSGLNIWSPRDAGLIRLNSHPLVRPGMSMDAVREVIVLTDELLDYPQVESDGTPTDALEIVWRAYVALEEAGSASYQLIGGWTDRACNLTFGVRRGPIELSIGNFRVFKDDPALISLDFHTSQFYIAYSRKDAEFLHWQLSPGGTWEKVEREIVVDASSYWLWNGKLHRAIRSVLMDGSSEDISVDETSDGNLRLQVTLDDSYVNLWKWGPIDKTLDLTLVLNPETLAIEGYTWELHRNPDVYSGRCLRYKETATDGRLGVEIEVPEVIRNELAATQ